MATATMSTTKKATMPVTTATTMPVKRTADGGDTDDDNNNDDIINNDDPMRMMGSRWAASGRQEALERCATHPRQQSTNVNSLGRIDERERQFWGDGTTDKCQGEGD